MKVTTEIFKFELKQKVFYMFNNQVRADVIRQRLYKDDASGNSQIYYYVSGSASTASLEAHELFLTKEELLASL